MFDRSGAVVYRAENGGDPPVAHTLRRERPVHGGKVVWREDHTAIHAINEAIRRATEVLDEENDLIEQTASSVSSPMRASISTGFPTE